ncbi:MAG TPA: YihY/virulence factor BrkB family protein [Vicinamibacterales bacterium]|nr:YihY/virulence factor BrkB family protein [Vicinamibacterales bacterium]
MAGRRAWRRLRLELRLSGQAAWRAAVGLVKGNDLTHAASIAFYGVLCLFPFLLLVMSVLGSITADEADRAQALAFLFRNFPARLDFLTDQLDALRQKRLGIGVAGALGLMWASLGFFGAVTSAVDEAWGVERQRSFWKHRLVSFLMLVAAGSTLAVALVLVSFFHVAQASWFGQILASFGWLVTLQTFVFRYLATLLLVLGVGLVFYFIPNARTRFRDVWVGALLTGVLWRAAFSGFAWYIRQNEGLSMIHGSIAAVIVFLLWIYISSAILMYGVEFTAAYARLRRHRRDGQPAAATPRT